MNVVTPRTEFIGIHSEHVVIEEIREIVLTQVTYTKLSWLHTEDGCIVKFMG
jgi:hypothetical protein